MIVLGANLLFYAYDSGSPKHSKARPWLEEILSDSEPVGLPWQTAAAFVRISTNPVFPRRLSLQQAVEIVDQWVEQPNVRLLAPGQSHWPLLRQMLTDGQASGPLVTDAALAALTLECGGVLHTTDRDFARFPGLRWTNPLESK